MLSSRPQARQLINSNNRLLILFLLLSITKLRKEAVRAKDAFAYEGRQASGNVGDADRALRAGIEEPMLLGAEVKTY